MSKNPSHEAQFYSKSFGKNLKAIRECLEISQAEFAKRAHTTPAAICQYENGSREPGLSTIISILQALGCSFERLIR